MTREELIQAIPSIDQLYVLYSVHTRSTYVVCEEKTQDDAAVVYFDEVEADFDMEKQWKSYQKKFPYAADLTWEVVMTSVRDIYKRTKA